MKFGVHTIAVRKHNYQRENQQGNKDDEVSFIHGLRYFEFTKLLFLSQKLQFFPGKRSAYAV
ncbi:MAG: hypothetical protein RAP70_02390 [Candidatus Celaenobacter antarcticus]|nr:hypothetical protein [Candidatus Celaenobacter antarcticus]MDP8313632.1 hypothetical protein [Candidatus Celaenobacter antarcticus]MDP8313903.1 hypothetical protein [Candidatus Celaenobacter antarcticus]